MPPRFGTGSLALSISETTDWPSARAHQIDTPNCFPLCAVQVVAQPDGSIKVTIHNTIGGRYTLTSPRIERNGDTPIKFCFRWNEQNAALAVAGIIVDKTDEKVDFIEPVLVIKEKGWMPDAGLQDQLNELSAQKRATRTEDEQEKKPRMGKDFARCRKTFGRLKRELMHSLIY
ncbi:MAG: hypothetical protein HRU33_10915 [Rhodobacteraceae bacterium]|nr:hypothetical protein [Paracoccaceae bacterium]